MVSDIIAILAMFFSVYTYTQLRISERKVSCLTFYQLWFSSQVMDARHYAAPKLDNIRSRDTKPFDLADDDRLCASISLIEHFITDLHRLLVTDTIESRLARPLFAETITAWVDRLEEAIYADDCPARSFHVGKSPIQAKKDFFRNVAPISLWFASPVASPKGKARHTRPISGAVSAPAGTFLGGIGLELRDDAGAVVETRTFEDGAWYVPRLVPGRYVLQVATSSLEALGVAAEPVALIVPAEGDEELTAPALELRKRVLAGGQ